MKLSTRLKTFGVLNLLWLTACSAQLQIGRVSTPPPEPVETPPECKLFLRSPHTPIPVLPDIAKEKDIDSEKLNLIQALYIKQLREFIHTERARLDEEYNRYVRKCL